MNHITPGLWADEKPEPVEIELELEQEYWPNTEAQLQFMSTSEKLSYASSAFKRMLEASKKGEMAFLATEKIAGTYIDYMVYDELASVSNRKHDKHRTRPKSYSGRPNKW